MMKVINDQAPMTAENFCYWLQGYFEIMNADMASALSPQQVKMIRDHLGYVFATPIAHKEPQTTASVSVGEASGASTSAMVSVPAEFYKKYNNIQTVC